MSKPETDWKAKASFMREHGAIAAEWTEAGELLKLTLGPIPAAGPAARMAAFHERTAESVAHSAAEKMKRQHDVLFAASSVRPSLGSPATPPHAVPRAVAAKEAAKRRGDQG